MIDAKNLIEAGIFDRDLERLIEQIPERDITLKPDDMENIIAICFNAGVRAGIRTVETEKATDETVEKLTEYLN